MIEVILDVSANTFRNDPDYFKRMVQEIKNIDSKKYQIIFKTQLFNQFGEAAKINKILTHDVFEKMYTYCFENDYKFTSSVFDISSLSFLLSGKFNIPFVKIACREELYDLIGSIPRKIPIYISADLRNVHSINWVDGIEILECIPEYPAKANDYDRVFKYGREWINISDHTPGIKLFNKFIEYHRPEQIEEKELKSIFEMHYVLERDTKNPDAGPFAKTIDELKEIL